MLLSIVPLRRRFEIQIQNDIGEDKKKYFQSRKCSIETSRHDKHGKVSIGKFRLRLGLSKRTFSCLLISEEHFFVCLGVDELVAQQRYQIKTGTNGLSFFNLFSFSSLAFLLPLRVLLLPLQQLPQLFLLLLLPSLPDRLLAMVCNTN